MRTIDKKTAIIIHNLIRYPIILIISPLFILELIGKLLKHPLIKLNKLWGGWIMEHFEIKEKEEEQ